MQEIAKLDNEHNELRAELAQRGNELADLRRAVRESREREQALERECAAAQAALERVKQSDKYRARAAQERDLVEQCGRLRALLQRK